VTTVQLHNVALDRAAKLGTRVSIVTLDLSSARVPGLTLELSGAPIDPATWTTAIELDGGAYEFRATAPGYMPWSATIMVAAEKERKVIAVPSLVAVETKPPVDTTKQPVDTSKPPVDTTKPPVDGSRPNPDRARVVGGRPPSRTLAYVVGGSGIALAATGLVFHLLAGSAYDDALAEGNDDNQKRYWDTANTRRYIAIGTGVAGVAALGTGVWLFLRARPDERVTVQPAVGSQGASVLVSGWF